MSEWKPGDVADRFWTKVDKTGDCWVWTASRDGRGYGRLAIGRVPQLAHRVSWFLATGHLPARLCVCHRCDNPPCVRPDHLFLGTHQDNMRDMLAKGRGSTPPNLQGESHPMALIPNEQIREARESYAEGREVQHEIAARLGVGQTTVGTWLRGDRRRDAGGPIAPRHKRRTRQEMAA